MFWAGQDKRLNRMYPDEEGLSDELKDLVDTMLSLDSNKRPLIQEIKDHAWYNGPVPTESEISAEFTERYQNLCNVQQREIALTDEFGTVYRGEGEGENDEEDKREAEKYDPKQGEIR